MNKKKRLYRTSQPFALLFMLPIMRPMLHQQQGTDPTLLLFFVSTCTLVCAHHNLQSNVQGDAATKETLHTLPSQERHEATI